MKDHNAGGNFEEGYKGGEPEMIELPKEVAPPQNTTDNETKYDLRPSLIKKFSTYGYYYAIRMPIQFCVLASVHLTYGIMHFVREVAPREIIGLAKSPFYALPKSGRASKLSKLLLLGASVAGSFYLWRAHDEKVKQHLNSAMEMISQLSDRAPTAVNWLKYHIEHYDTSFARIWGVITDSAHVIQSEFHKPFAQQGFIYKLLAVVGAFIAGFDSQEMRRYNFMFGAIEPSIAEQTSGNLFKKISEVVVYSLVCSLGFACGMPIGSFASTLFGVTQFSHLAQLAGGVVGVRLSYWGCLLGLAGDGALPRNANFHSLPTLLKLCFEQAKVDAHNTLSDITPFMHVVDAAPTDKPFVYLNKNGDLEILPKGRTMDYAISDDHKCEAVKWSAQAPEEGGSSQKTHLHVIQPDTMRQPQWKTNHQQAISL